MKKTIFIAFAILFTLNGNAQMKLIKKLLSDEKDTTRKASFMPLPVFGYAQETGFEFGVGGMYSFYADKKDTTNRSSNIFSTASISTKKTFNFSLRGDYWSKGNTYHIIPLLRFKKMPFDFYGVGNNTAEINKDRLEQTQLKILFDLEKKLMKNAYTGVSLGFENYTFKDKVAGGLFETNPAIKGKTGGTVLFVGVSQSYDTRNTNNYTTKGFFGRVTYQYAPDLFGGDNFTGSQISLNLRNFWPIGKKFVFAVQGLYNIIQSNNTPFYLVPQMGTDEMMRGYYNGRYRDENLLAAQAEIRFRYNSRFGGVVFGGTGTVWGQSKFDTDQFKPNYGGGLRYFFDPAKGLSVRLDYGIGEKKPNEKRQTGFYISMAEAF
jgi:outer membrane translocation and assembly module TamA